MEGFSGEIQFNQSSLFILNICIGFILFGVALDLKLSDFKFVVLNPKAAIAGFISQFLLLPTITYLMIIAFSVPQGYALGMILVAACPGGNISNFISHLAKANTALSISMTALATLSAAVLTPLNFTLWSRLLLGSEQVQYFTLDPLKLAETIFLIMAVPIFAGMVFNNKLPQVTQKIKKTVRILSMLIFVGFIVIAIANNFKAFTSNFDEIFLLVLGHNAIAYTAGLSMGFLFRLPLADRKTITIETGIQNSGLGLVIIFTFFGGAADMALVAAWWGVWHGISGSILAFLWSKRT